MVEDCSVLKKGKPGSNLTCRLPRERSHQKRLHAVWFQLDDVLEKETYGDRQKISGCQGLGVRRDERAEPGKATLHGPIMGDLGHCTCVKTHRTCDKHQSKLQTPVTAMRQHGFISCHKCTTVVGDTDNGGGMRVWERKGYHLNSGYCLLNFAMDLKQLGK